MYESAFLFCVGDSGVHISKMSPGRVHAVINLFNGPPLGLINISSFDKKSKRLAFAVTIIGRKRARYLIGREMEHVQVSAATRACQGGIDVAVGASGKGHCLDFSLE